MNHIIVDNQNKPNNKKSNKNINDLHKKIIKLEDSSNSCIKPSPLIAKSQKKTNNKIEKHRSNDNVEKALTEKLKRLNERRKKQKIILMAKEKTSVAEKRRIWRGDKGIFDSDRLSDWYKHMVGF